VTDKLFHCLLQLPDGTKREEEEEEEDDEEEEKEAGLLFALAPGACLCLKARLQGQSLGLGLLDLFLSPRPFSCFPVAPRSSKQDQRQELWHVQSKDKAPARHLNMGESLVILSQVLTALS